MEHASKHYGHAAHCLEIRGLSKFQEYIPIYEGDRYCLMCGQACPVRRVTRNEATSPHGWALLVASVQRGMLTWNAETVDVLYRCADCGNCQGNCATDRPLPYAIQAARAEIVRLGKGPAALAALDEKLRAWGNPYGAVKHDNPVRDNNAPSSTVLFVGDSAHFETPEIVRAAEKLLRAVKVDAAPFGAGLSNGYLPYTLGLWDTARKLARETVAALNELGAARVITLGPRDAHTFIHIYPELGVEMPQDVVTLVKVLANAGHLLDLETRTSGAYTYHDAAHTVRLPGHAAAARAVAEWAMGGAPREMLMRENLATPIGTTGGLQFSQPVLAAALARTRIQEARETGAEIILTDDPMDTATLEQYADGLEVLNLYRVLAGQLQGDI